MTDTLHAEAVRYRAKDEQQQSYVDQANRNAQHLAGPIGRRTPNGAIPEPLREKQQRQDAKTNPNAEQQPGPIQMECPPKTNHQLT
ncbi:MAG: hypothetical protein WBH24_00330, partial [Candidatus Acidiferrum sp.]